MKKLIFSQIILFACVFSTFSQNELTLDEQIATAVVQNLPEWKAVNPAKPFQRARGGYSGAIEGQWTMGRRTLEITLHALKSANINKNFDSFSHPFLMRGVIPPNRRIENLGDSAHLVESANLVEIAFYKANIYASLNLRFPDTRQNKTVPPYYATAPKEEVEKALEFARVVADAVDGEKTVSLCQNDFYRFDFPSNTDHEKLFAAVASGDTAIVRALLQQKNVNVNLPFADGATLMHLAVRQGCSETVKLLIEAGADINAKTVKGITPLMVAASFGDFKMTEQLIAAGADVSAKDQYQRNAIFHVVGVEAGTFSITGVPIGWRFGQEPPRSRDKIEIVKLLAKSGANVDEKSSLDAKTPLLSFHCQDEDCQSLFIVLLDLGADINGAPTDTGKTPLISAAENGSAESVKFLLSRGADVNRKDKKGMSALAHVLQRRKIYEKDAFQLKKFDETIRLLKNAGAIE